MIMFTVTQTAKKLSISRQRVLQLISAKKLEAKKVGNAWLVMSLKRR